MPGTDAKTRRHWTAADDQALKRVLRKNGTYAQAAAATGRTHSAVYQRAFKIGLAAVLGSPEWRAKVAHAGFQPGETSGRAYAFKKGHVPWNRDLKGIHLSPASEFKKGCLRGKAARLYQAIGNITIRTDGGKQFRWIKIKDGGRPLDRWIPYARYLWQKTQGPIPHGWFVVHADGDTMNDDLSNLRLVTNRGHIQTQRARDPEMERRRMLACIAPASRAKRRRTLAQRRGIKAAIRNAAEQKRRSA